MVKLLRYVSDGRIGERKEGRRRRNEEPLKSDATVWETSWLQYAYRGAAFITHNHHS